MYISILGRQPTLGMAELEKLFSDTAWFGKYSAIFEADNPDITELGGSQKLGLVTIENSGRKWQDVSVKIVQEYYSILKRSQGKITLGISAYGFDGVNPRDIQKTGIILKNKLKSEGVSLRLIPNQDPALSTATSHHNKLGLSDNKIELLVVSSGSGKIIVAESIGSQNITAYASRDQARPKRDAFVGMLPPKLAQIMINLALVEQKSPSVTLLDPFCGTGVILQEAALKGLSVYGTDLAEKMVSYSRENLEWLSKTHHVTFNSELHTGNAIDTKWQQPINLVVTESYLGQPFSAPPSWPKLTEVMGNCDNIITAFLRNVGSQLAPGTPLCIAVPAWKQVDGSFSHLPIVDTLGKYGYKPHEFKNVSKNELLYFREDQVVARELLVMTKA